MLRMSRDLEMERASVERLLSAGLERKPADNTGIEQEGLQFHAGAGQSQPTTGAGRDRRATQGGSYFL